MLPLPHDVHCISVVLHSPAVMFIHLFFHSIALLTLLHWYSWSVFIYKVSRSLGTMCRSRDLWASNTLEQLYLSLVYPYLSCWIRIDASTHDSHSDKLMKLQRRSLRVIDKRYNLAHTHKLFNEIRVLKFKNIYVLNIRVLGRKTSRRVFIFTLSPYETCGKSRLVPSRNLLSTTESFIFVFGSNVQNNFVIPFAKFLLWHQSSNISIKTYSKSAPVRVIENFICPQLNQFHFVIVQLCMNNIVEAWVGSYKIIFKDVRSTSCNHYS